MKYVRVREHVPPPRPLASVIPCNVDKKLSLFVWADFEPHPLKSTRTLLTPPHPPGQAQPSKYKRRQNFVSVYT